MIFSELHWYGFLIALFIGLGTGSYATMPAHRLPRGEAPGGRWVGPRSRCPKCKHQLRTRDLVPVFNWLLTRGQCAFCGAKISLNYLFIEASCAVISVLLYWRFNISDDYMLLLGLGACLVILLSTDWHYKIFPKQVLYVMLLLGVAHRVMHDHTLFHLINSFGLAILLCFAFKDTQEKKKKKFKRVDYLFFVALVGAWLNLAELITYFAMVGIVYLMLRALNAKAYGAALILPLFAHLVIMDVPAKLAAFLK